MNFELVRAIERGQGSPKAVSGLRGRQCVIPLENLLNLSFRQRSTEADPQP